MTSVREVRLSARAERDVKLILQDSLDTWGLERREAYSRELTELLQSIREYPEIGRSRPELFSGARSLPFGQHVIYYRIDREIVRIIRIRHARTDVSRIFGRPLR